MHFEIILHLDFTNTFSNIKENSMVQALNNIVNESVGLIKSSFLYQVDAVMTL